MPEQYNLPSNSNKSRAEKAQGSKPERPELKPVARGVERKKPLHKRVGESFAGDDAQSVGQYVLFDVILPQAKSLIADVVSQGIERLLWGDSSRRSTGRTNYTSYSKPTSLYTGPSASTTTTGGRQMSERARAVHDTSEIILKTRGEAESVIEILRQRIHDYDVVTFGELLTLVESTPAFTDEKYGWNNLDSARVERVRAGYLLRLPPTIVLD